MAHDPHHITVPAVERFDLRHAGMLPKYLLFAGIAGIAGSLVGLASDAWREQFAHSWLFALVYFFTICVGALFWTALHHASDAEWSVVVRRVWENTAHLVIAFAVLFLPLLLGCQKYLWRWWDLTGTENADPLLVHKSAYLSHSFFLERTAVYILLISLVAWFLRSHSIAQDSDGAAKHTFAMRKWGVFGIPVIGLCLTFAAFDWLMGLDYHWFSTMWGVYIFAGAAGSSMALTVLVVSILRKMGYLKPVTMEHYHIMGKFLLTFTIFWAYIGFSQYMLIWYANIPEETIYFRVRNTGTWWWLSMLLVIGRFFLPFAFLLIQNLKKDIRWICGISAWMLLMHLLDIYVIVLPSLHPLGFSPSIFDLLAFVGIGGIMGWLWIRRIATASLFPTRDPRLAASLNLTN